MAVGWSRGRTRRRASVPARIMSPYLDANASTQDSRAQSKAIDDCYSVSGNASNSEAVSYGVAKGSMASAGIRHGQQDFILGHEWVFTPLDQRALLAHFSKDLQSPVQVFIFVGCHVASPD